MSRKVVLLVGQDPQFFERPENSFQSRGCDVFTAMSGKEAMTFLQSNSADLVIVQEVPEGTDAERFKRVAKDAHVILITTDPSAGKPWAGIPGNEVIAPANVAKALLKASVRVLGLPERKYVSILVQVRVTNPKPTTVFGKSRDVSETGILVETSQTLVIHDTVTVSFLIPGAERMIQANAVVMREVDSAGGAKRYGLQFHSLSQEDADIVSAFLGGKLEESEG